MNLCFKTVILENLGYLLREQLNVNNVVDDGDGGIT